MIWSHLCCVVFLKQRYDHIILTHKSTDCLFILPVSSKIHKHVIQSLPTICSVELLSAFAQSCSPFPHLPCVPEKPNFLFIARNHAISTTRTEQLVLTPTLGWTSYSPVVYLENTNSFWSRA